MRQQKRKDSVPYKFFIGLSLVIIAAGVIMKIKGYRGMHDIGFKYGPTERAGITGTEVMLLGLLMLVVTYFLFSNKRIKKQSSE